MPKFDTPASRKLQEITSNINELQKHKRLLKRENKAQIFELVKELASCGKLAISSDFASYVQHFGMVLTNTEMREIVQYLRDCENYQAIQNSFERFYKSSAYTSIMNQINIIPEPYRNQAMKSVRPRKTSLRPYKE